MSVQQKQSFAAVMKAAERPAPTGTQFIHVDAFIAGKKVALLQCNKPGRYICEASDIGSAFDFDRTVSIQVGEATEVLFRGEKDTDVDDDLGGYKYTTGDKSVTVTIAND